MSNLDYGVVGNCAFAALVDPKGRIVWSCLPRFDGDPVFCSLLDGDGRLERGFWDVDLLNLAQAEQAYQHNSGVLRTRLYDTMGGGIEITDFAPRFKQYERVFRPQTLVRRVTPLRGSPRVRIRLRPACNYGARKPEITRGSNHIRYVLANMTLRLNTDVPVAYILDELPHVLEWPVTMMLGADESLTAPVAETGRAFYEKTEAYWRDWTRALALPFEWQEAVIRAAITLKMCSYEETGAVMAALTTSIPEAANSGRNWDYRFCWLRDSYFVVRALNRLSATRTMEGFLAYITNVVADSEDGPLQPLFGLGLERNLEEREEPALSGFRGMGPVRVGNHAYLQRQNDVYGAVVLASAQAFFDLRLTRPGDEALFARLEFIGEKAAKLWDQPDAGPWEYRNRTDVHTFSAVMCWAACDRLARIARQLGLSERERYWGAHAETIRHDVLKRAWNPKIGSLTATFGGSEIDASLLLLPTLGFVSGDDPRFTGTLAYVERRLRYGDMIFRYVAADDFGVPETSFTVCTFWYIDALVSVGRQQEARALFEKMLATRNHLGLMSEDMDPHTGELWGNFPQTYSLVGLINSALHLSQPWEDAF